VSQTEIKRLREEIRLVDQEIVAMVAKRSDLASQIGLEKKILGRRVRDEGAEAQVRRRIRQECARRGISSGFAAALSSILIRESVRLQRDVRPPRPVHQRVLVVGGAGQMGAWLCRYFRRRGFDVVVNDPAGPLEPFPFEPDLADAVKDADIIAVSVPMSASADVLGEIAALQPRGLIFDICSLKAPIQDLLRAMGRSGLRVVSVHPMFGPNFWPLSSGSMTFSDCGNAAAVAEAKELFRPSGANLIDMPLDDHDEFMAFLLGLSHLCLLTFARSAANGPIDFGGLRRSAGTTFSRLSSAAASLLSDSPALIRDIQALNPHTAAVHRRVRDALDEWRRAAEARDAAEFVGLIEDTRKYFGGGSLP
jgi:chorismate mutase / prephenate dehydrogenase